MENMIIKWNQMDEFTSIPPEYRFVDEVSVIPGVSASGEKNVSHQEWYFKVRDSKKRSMPKEFLFETILQTGMFIITVLPQVREKLMLFRGCNDIKMYDTAYPGDVIKTEVELKSYHHGIARYHGTAKCTRGGGRSNLVFDGFYSCCTSRCCGSFTSYSGSGKSLIYCLD